VSSKSALPAAASFEAPRPVITLLTDFGTRDVYVGIMRGVILGLAPSVQIVDLSHEIAPQAIAEAAFLLDSAAPYFPWGTIHVAVIDPGVGTERRIVCARTSRATYLAPDNGLLARILERDPPAHLVSVENAEYFLPTVSTTFHGRDIFAPVAAHLANGLDPRSLGPVIRELTPLPFPQPRRTAPGVLTGEVIHVDRFGNLVTNVGEPFAANVASLTIHGKRIEGPVCRAYGERDLGEPLLIFGSSGFLEISVNSGDAARVFRARRGDAVSIAVTDAREPQTPRARPRSSVESTTPSGRRTPHPRATRGTHP
jgi:S-adenosylmethionine hydrolase